jgi:hypothetical protein
VLVDGAPDRNKVSYRGCSKSLYRRPGIASISLNSSLNKNELRE